MLEASMAETTEAALQTTQTCEAKWLLPAVADVAVQSDGSEAAFATSNGAIVCELNHHRKELAYYRATGPQIGPSVTRVAFSCRDADHLSLASASGRSVCVVDLLATSSAANRSSSELASDAPLLETRGAVVSCLSSHLRPVNALDWSPHDANLLATCGEDCRFYIWDIRQPQPAQSLLLPASWTCSLKWAPLREKVLATGHEDTICVWDIRSPLQHMNVLAPGQNRVLGIDWSRLDREKLLSVSAQQGVKAASSGSIKVWDLSSPERVHDTIAIENGMPGAARFLPFGRAQGAILAAVESTVVLFSYESDAAAKDKVNIDDDASATKQRWVALETFQGHAASVNFVDFASHPEGSNDGSDWRIISMSSAERCLRTWKLQLLGEDLRGTALSCESYGTGTREDTSASRPIGSPSQSPHLGPMASPSSFSRQKNSEQQEAVNHAREAQYKQAAELRKVECVDDVMCTFQGTPDGGVEYQLKIDVTAANDISFRMTVVIDATAPVLAANVRALQVSERGLRCTIEWLDDDWKGTFNGPLAPGVIDEIKKNLTLEDFLANGPELCNCIRSLVKMLLRRDNPPRLGSNLGSGVIPEKQRRTKDAELPFPRTCGICWSPQGDLLFFKSLQNVQVPHRWNNTHFRRVLKIHSEKDRLVRDDVDEHTEVASKLQIDNTVQFVPSLRLRLLVEDHWWADVGPIFMVQPTSVISTMKDLCHHNQDVAMSIGRQDLAEVWRLMSVLASDVASAPSGSAVRSCGTRLVRQIIHQLFDAQETLTLAMVGTVLLAARGSCFTKRGTRQLGRAGGRRLTYRASRTTAVAGTEASASRSPQKSRNSKTWSPSSWELPDLAAKMLSQSQRSSQSFALRDLPWSAENTLSGASQAAPHSCPPDSPEASSPPKGKQALGGPPGVVYSAAEQEFEDLLPKDPSSLDRLLHSAHAQCDLLHRLEKFSMSRCFAKLLERLSKYHELPLHEAKDENKFGRLTPLPVASSSALALYPTSSGSELQSLDADSRASPTSEPSLPPFSEPADSGQPICAVCCKRVSGLYTPCWSCGHGFHMPCFRRWFTASDQKCPAIGCECKCLESCAA
eukprot:TRINITY_DN95805_c0_g1_i1.p1 TRINITY_DN95805_c0_g1~~TRINITY_DN95805_c0_g1_i1.p1  ORF type:complete len:1084 (-),score=186.15 TRINITY_DN95805_c0_g1_i1:105-3356(-)